MSAAGMQAGQERDSHKPLAVDLFCGKGGWTVGLQAAGWRCRGYDIADMGGYPGELHLRDVRTITGEEVAGADLLVASPPCQEYSYMAMPWKRSKQIAAALRGQGQFPSGYSGSRTRAELNGLFCECFRIQRDAVAARGGCPLPMVVENVVGAQPWVGRAAWHYGSFYLWGDVPAIMPKPGSLRDGGDGINPVSGSTFTVADSKNRGLKTQGHANIRDGHTHTRHLTNQAESDGIKAGDRNPNGRGWSNSFAETLQRGTKQGGEWWHDPTSFTRLTSSRSSARKEASARIAMIPFALAHWIGECYYPHQFTAPAPMGMGVRG